MAAERPNRQELRGAALLLLVFGGSVAIFAGLPGKLLGSDGARVDAVFRSTAKLSVGNPVRINGVAAGKVDAIEPGPTRGTSRVRLKLDDKAQVVYRNATATIKWRTALGGNYAVVLDRGTAPAGRLGGQPIPATQTENQVEVDQILAEVGASQRLGLQTMLKEVPKALANPRQPARALKKLADTSPGITRGVSTLRGREEHDLRRLVTNTGAAVAALDAPRDGLRTVVQGAASTFVTTGRRARDIRAALVQAAEAVPLTTSTLRQVDHTLELADPLLARLQGPARDVAPTVAALRPVVAGADALLQRARPLIRDLRPTVDSLRVTADQVVPLIDALRPSVERLNEQILPGLAKVDPESKRPAYQMIGPSVAGLEGAAGAFDSSGFTFRFAASSNERAIDTAPCKTYLTDPTANQIVSCEALLKALPSLVASPQP